MSSNLPHYISAVATTLAIVATPACTTVAPAVVTTAAVTTTITTPDPFLSPPLLRC